MSPEDDLELFRQLNADVKPIEQDKVEIKSKITDSVNAEQRRLAAENNHLKDHNYLSDAEVPPVEPLDVLAFKLDGLQTGVFKKLRLGKYDIEAHLDLHRHTVAEARQATYRFIQNAKKLECRTLLITHGKGERSDPPARLKSYVNYWLKQIPEVMAFHSAIQKHGGVGSVYVLLKKSNEKRVENRERFR